MNEITSLAAPTPPHSVEAEQQLLGALLTNNDLAHRITGKIKADDLFDPVHRCIFEHAMGRIQEDKLASPITLFADMGKHDGLHELGGAGYLARLAGASISASSIADYAAQIVEFSRRRAVLDLCADMTNRIMQDEPADVSCAEMEMFLHTQEPSGAPRSMSLLKAHTEALQDVMDAKAGNSPAVPSGLASLDAELRLARKRYTILGGTTSMGKTAAALSIAYHAAKEGFGVGFVSREMPERDLAARMNSIDSKVPYKAFDRPMSDGTLDRVAEAVRIQAEYPIEIFSSQVDDMPSILSEAKKLQKKWATNGPKFGLGLLVVDYIQLIKGKGNNFEVLSSVANELKQVAKLLDVHVLALAQIDRKVMEREDARPMLSDLRGSGDLENAPDNVMFCHREEYFLQRKTLPKKTEELADHMELLDASRGKMEYIIAKARMGEITTVTVGCDMATNRFWDLDSTQDMEF